MKETKITAYFLLWVYIVVFGMVIILAAASFGMYRSMADSTAEITGLESHKVAVTTFGNVAQSFADLVKVALGAVIGAMSAILQSVISQTSAKMPENQVNKPEVVETKVSDKNNL